MAAPAKDTEEMDPDYDLLSKPIVFQAKGSSLFRFVGLGLVAGGSAGGCMGVMAAEMVHFLNGSTELTAKIGTEPEWSLTSTAYITYMCLLVASLASAAGVLCGHQVYNLVKRQTWGEASGNASALAAPVAALVMAVSGAALGAFPEKLILDFPLFPVRFPGISFTYLIIVIIIMLCLLIIVKHACVWIGLFLTLVIAGILSFHSLTNLSAFVPLLDLDSIFPLFFVSMLITHKTPRIVITLLFIAMSVLPYQEESVPLDSVASSPHVLQRLFLIMLAVQIFQASGGAVLYSDFVSDGAGKVCIGALAASAGVLLVLPNISPMLGAGASLGGLLAASGATGVALQAAGELGQRHGGHVGRAGGVIGAALGAFLPLMMQDVKFGMMMAACTAAIPGSTYVVLGLDFLYNLHPAWHIVLMIVYVPISVFVQAFISTGIYVIVAFHFTVFFHRIGLTEIIFRNLLHTRLTSLNVNNLFSVDQMAAKSGDI